MAKAVSLLFLLGCPFLVAQSTSFDIKTGRWQFTETDITTAKGDPKAAEIPKVILDGTRNMPPDQRAKYLALVAKNLKANDAAIRQPRTTTESWGFCLDATKIRNGNLANKGYECRTSYTSGPNRIYATFACNGLPESTQLFQRTDQTHFTGKLLLNEAAYTEASDITASWVDEESCADGPPVAIPNFAGIKQAPVSQPNTTVSRGTPPPGANRDVLSFLPFLQNHQEGRFGVFTYYWGQDNPNIPFISYDQYHGLIPGVSESGGYFHGTDGQFLYVTLGTLCGGTTRQIIRIDRSAQVTRIDQVPQGLRGGKDALTGGPPCRGKAAGPNVPPTPPAPRPVIALLSGKYVLAGVRTDQPPAAGTTVMFVAQSGPNFGVSTAAIGAMHPVFRGAYTSNPFDVQVGMTREKTTITVTSPTSFFLGPTESPRGSYHRLDEALQK